MTKLHLALPEHQPVPEPKEQISLRLDAAIVQYYRATGRGWQTRLNADLAYVVEVRRKVESDPDLLARAKWLERREQKRGGK